MSKIHKDHLGREIGLGDWCAMTQNNTIYVGKIIRISEKGAPTIARDSVEEFIATDKKLNKIKSWQDRNAYLKSKFSGASQRLSYSMPSWCRDGKFVKIKPTDDMIVSYDVQPKKN